MKKKPAAKAAPARKTPAKAVATKPRSDSLAPLIAEVRSLVQSARRSVASVIDTFQVLTNFEIGRRIVEHEQQGAKRAAYGSELLKELSARLTAEFGRGFSRPNLEYMRKFFLVWRDRVPQICQKPSDKLTTQQKTIGREEISETPSRKSSRPFTLSWSHYVELLTVKDHDERNFYEIEATNEGWSLPELRRQKAACWLALEPGPTPAGVIEISRWLSEATPPDRDRQVSPIPEGWQNRLILIHAGRRPECCGSGIPSGCLTRRGRLSGGVAPLNHRLIADIPPGWGTLANMVFCWISRSPFASPRLRVRPSSPEGSHA